MAKDKYNTLRNELSDKCYILRVDIVPFQLHFNHKYSFDFVALGNSWKRLRSNQINEVEPSDISIESVTLCLFQLKFGINLSLWQRSLNIG